MKGSVSVGIEADGSCLSRASPARVGFSRCASPHRLPRGRGVGTGITVVTRATPPASRLAALTWRSAAACKSLSFHVSVAQCPPL